jgi:hypothetical protein
VSPGLVGMGSAMTMSTLTLALVTPDSPEPTVRSMTKIAPSRAA